MRCVTLLVAAAASALAHAAEAPAAAGCPSTVPGAVTTVQNRKDGISLTVLASDEHAADEIKRRAAAAANGFGGDCPGAAPNTAVKLQELPDGAILTVTARAAGEAPQLQQETRARLRRLQGGRQAGP